MQGNTSGTEGASASSMQGNSSSTEGAYPVLRNLRIVLDLPYSPTEFDAMKQEKCKNAVAIAAGTSPDKVRSSIPSL
jgi:hypothetical protein